jgi:hypothetical protein
MVEQLSETMPEDLVMASQSTGLSSGASVTRDVAMSVIPPLTSAEPSVATIVGSRFGRDVRRYFRMRFCSPDCLKAYQQRLDKLTRVKIERINLSPALSDEASKAA